MGCRGFRPRGAHPSWMQPSTRADEGRELAEAADGSWPPVGSRLDPSRLRRGPPRPEPPFPTPGPRGAVDEESELAVGRLDDQDMEVGGDEVRDAIGRVRHARVVGPAAEGLLGEAPAARAAPIEPCEDAQRSSSRLLGQEIPLNPESSTRSVRASPFATQQSLEAPSVRAHESEISGPEACAHPRFRQRLTDRETAWIPRPRLEPLSKTVQNPEQPPPVGNQGGFCLEGSQVVSSQTTGQGAIRDPSRILVHEEGLDRVLQGEPSKEKARLVGRIPRLHRAALVVDERHPSASAFGPECDRLFMESISGQQPCMRLGHLDEPHDIGVRDHSRIVAPAATKLARHVRQTPRRTASPASSRTSTTW